MRTRYEGVVSAALPADRKPNRLAGEASPYLLQHAHNPVAWCPWGPEALAEAKSRDVPILLSIGYSACHWCHVMERESFESDAIAKLMNDHYVCIKVDREERPDLDQIYQLVVQLMGRSGGWPLTVFLTPEQKPFFAGTYFPPADRYGMPGFPKILGAVAEAYRERRGEIDEQAAELTKAIAEVGRGESDGTTPYAPGPDLLARVSSILLRGFDETHGGFGKQPKFPNTMPLEVLLRRGVLEKDGPARDAVRLALESMRNGGIWDQLGGGFHRYSTDERWLVPHFEKMLYDNAQLAQTYAHCYQVTGKAFYKGNVLDILDYILREMTSDDGAFYSAQDADSEGVEGKYFVWTAAEIRKALGERDAGVFSEFFNITSEGNWEGKNILRIVQDAHVIAEKYALEFYAVEEILEIARFKLLEIRAERVKPGLDDKTLTGWNGLMISAMAECGAIFDREEFVQAATNSAEFIMKHLSLRDKDGFLRLLRTNRLGQSKLNGCLEDYAFFAEGLIKLYEATFELRWLETARELLNSMLTYFWDDLDGGFFATSSDHEKLIQRLKDWEDNAIPCGNTVALEVMLQIGRITGDTALLNRVSGILMKISPIMAEHPAGFTRLLGVLDSVLSGSKEAAIIGPLQDASMKELHSVLYRTYLPNHTFVHASSLETAPRWIPLLEQRGMLNGKPTAYVCENMACKSPTNDPIELALQLK